MAGTNTIYALSTPPGTSGVAVIRLTGPQCGTVLSALTNKPSLPPRQAVLTRLIHPETKNMLDSALALSFPAPSSFTGEDMLELHTHGGRAVVAAVLGAIADTGCCRMAEAGEFTRRAFDNGKIDLTGSEALADLIHAETEFQRRQAMVNLQGGLREQIEGWRQDLIRIMAYCDATLDFSDEELPDTLESDLAGQMDRLIQEMEALLNTHPQAERMRDGIDLAILGAPNAGKSSLLNALTGRAAAITSDIAGTTRDIVETHLDIAGYPFILADTAGLRGETEDRIEREGIKRAETRAKAAQIRLIVLDSTTLPHIEPEIEKWLDEDAIIVLNKSDLATPDYARPHIRISTQTGEGLDALKNVLKEKAEQIAGTAETPTLNRHRQVETLRLTMAELETAKTAPAAELMAESIRHALAQLGRMTGHVDVESLLDVIFSDFCIGK